MTIIFLQIKGQELKIERTHSLKLGFLELGYAFEQPISSKSVFNIELNVSSGFGYNYLYGNYWAIAPSLRLEPRYYYNYFKRQKNNRKVINNSANYLAIAIDYQPGFGLSKNADPIQYLAIIPKWGLRRSIGNKFFFEFAAGYGLFKSEISEIARTIALDIKLGLKF